MQKLIVKRVSSSHFVTYNVAQILPFKPSQKPTVCLSNCPLVAKCPPKRLIHVVSHSRIHLQGRWWPKIRVKEMKTQVTQRPAPFPPYRDSPFILPIGNPRQDPEISLFLLPHSYFPHIVLTSGTQGAKPFCMAYAKSRLFLLFTGKKSANSNEMIISM